MESFAFELKLVDSVSASAKKAADAARAFEKQAEKTAKSLDFSDQLHRTEQQLHKLKFDPSGFQKLARAQKELAEQRKNLGKTGLTDLFNEKFSFGRMTGAAMAGEFLADALVEGAKKSVEILSEGIKKTFEVASDAQKLSLGYKLSLGEKGGESAEEDVDRFSRLIGMGSEQAQKLFLPLRRAGFDQEGARAAFAAAGDLSAGEGAGMGNVGQYLDLIKRVKLKGGISEKMMLGLGLDVKGFGKDLSKSGYSMKQAESGAMDPQTLLNVFYRQIQKRQGGMLGTGAVEFGKTMAGEFAQFQDLPNKYLKNLSKSQGWHDLEERFGGLLKQLDPNSPMGRKIEDSLLGTFNKLAKAASDFLTPDHIDEFAKSVSTAIDELSKLPKILSSAWSILKPMTEAWIAFKAANAVKGIAEGASDAAGIGGKLLKAAGIAGVGPGAALAGVGSIILLNEQQQAQTRAMVSAFNAVHPVDEEGAKYFGTEYAREHRATVRHGEMQIGDFGTEQQTRAEPVAAVQGGKVIHMNVQNVIHMRHEGDDDEKARKAAQHVEKHVAHAMEKATGHS